MAASDNDLSVLIPAYNEGKNVLLTYERVVDALGPVRKRYEILYIDDGSTDETYKELQSIHEMDPRVRVIRLGRNFGKTVALDVGFRKCRGGIIVQLDADLQNDPRDITLLLKKLDGGYDMVVGWRRDRKDPFWKRFFSLIYNRLRNVLLGDRLHDGNCPLRVYRRECVAGVALYSDMHRYLPNIVLHRGFRVGEVKVSHYPRIYGKSKYGLSRLARGFTDLLLVRFSPKSPPKLLRHFGVGVEDNLLKIISEL